MKKYINLFSLLILLSAFVLSCCDKIEGPYTTDKGNNGGTNDTVRKVLLEDFTGQKCVNCPQAHKIAKDLQTLYGNQLIVIAEHVGYYAVPTSEPLYTYDFRTQIGDDIWTQFLGSGTPIGMVNRKNQGGNHLVQFGNFATEVSKLIDSLPKAPDAYIYLEPSYNASDSTINVIADATFLKNFPSGKYKMSVVITESEIISAQKNNSAIIGTIPDIVNYHHMHVLRGTLNGSFGDLIKDGTPAKDEKISKTYSNYKLGSDWNPANCHLVAFLYYADGTNNWEIIQAQEVKIK